MPLLQRILSSIIRRVGAAAFACLLSGCVPGAARTSDRRTRVEPPVALKFEDVASKVGLRFRWGHNGKTPLTNLESFGCGCAFWDYDQDGWQDILLVSEPTCGLFHNEPDGKGGRRFVETTVTVGLDKIRGPWKGCAIGDWDNDGDTDLFLSGYHTAALVRCDSGRKMVDVTHRAQIHHKGWGSSAGFADYDLDGDLDLFVGNYVQFGPDSLQHCRFSGGAMGGCPPRTYPAEYGVLYRNDGDGTFTDVTAAVGMSDTHGKTLAVGWCDYDDDGDSDLYLANDGVAGDLFSNDRGRFTNVGLISGTAFGLNDAPQAGMCVDWADYDRDERFDLVVTAFSDEPYSLYRNEGPVFVNKSAEVGLAEPTRKPLGFGGRFVDVDNDGWQDLIFANGHVYDQSAKIDAASPYRQSSLLFRNEAGRRFRDVSAAAGEAVTRPIVGRGLATGDFDNDGRVDVLIVDYEGAPILARNVTPGTGHWFKASLSAGPVGTRNRYAWGAEVLVAAGSQRWLTQVNPCSSYLSSSDPRVHIGLGAETRIGSVTVTWPDGKAEAFKDLAVDTPLTLARGRGNGVP